jgi:Xaa-Pro dipeptidase
MRPPAFSLDAVRRALADLRLDGWLFCFFQKNDPIAEKILGVGAKFFTRRWYYFVRRRGEPVKVVHRIESDALDHLPGERRTYLSWEELHRTLRAVLVGGRVAMQYSPKNAVPYVARVDAGTVELVRSFGVRVVSSGDLVQLFESPITPAQWAQHQRTARHLRDIVFEAFGFVGARLRKGMSLGEYDVQVQIQKAYARRGLASNSYPIVAANRNSAQPHYVPSLRCSRPIRRGDWVLLDIWAKPKGADAVYADITWCGYAGRAVPTAYERIFGVVRDARDRAFALVEDRFRRRRPVRGWEVDRAARGHIERKGFGPYFIHRTGHSIGLEDHANGANMDSLETRETRRVLPNTLFSIEPGIYLKDFGARSEMNVFIDGERPVVSGLPVQKRVVPILGRRRD